MENEDIGRRTKLAFKLLADSQGIKLKEKDFPKVESNEDDAASFNPLTYTINIPPKDANSGISYFEEASHALRDLAQRRKFIHKIIPYKTDMQVQEFYGRVGETLGRELARGTELEPLLQNEPSRDLQDPQTREEWADRLKKARRLNKLARQYNSFAKEGREYISGVVSENYDLVTDLFNDFDSGRVSLSEFEERFIRLRRLQKAGYLSLRRKKDVGIDKLTRLESEDYSRKIGDIQEAINLSKKINDPKLKKEAIQRAVDYFRETYNPKNKFRDLGIVSKAELVSDLGIYSHLAHSRPYQFAQQYGAGEFLSQKGHYTMLDREIRKKFFRKKESGLEKSVGVLLFFSISILLINLFLNFSVTGSVVGEYARFSLPALFFLILSLILLKIKLTKFK